MELWKVIFHHEQRGDDFHGEPAVTLPETNIEMENGPGLKMYFLLMGIFHCYVSLPEGNFLFFFERKINQQTHCMAIMI